MAIFKGLIMLMMDLASVRQLLNIVGLKKFYTMLVHQLRQDFSDWDNFQKTARQASYFDAGAIELMPIANSRYYVNKVVSTYAENVKHQQFTVIGHGMLLDSQTGEMKLFCEMTLLTAIRTAAVSVLASQLMARKNTQVIAIIGCGAQSEFQVLAHYFCYPDVKWTCFDVQAKAMQRLQAHVKPYGVDMAICQSERDAVVDADIVITLTSALRSYPVLTLQDLKPNVHINALGGDSPGKSELSVDILKHAAQIMLEYFPQTLHEGEIQQDLNVAHADKVFELWEVLLGHRKARESDAEMTLFDGVGFALADYSCLQVVWQLAQKYQLGKICDLLPKYDVDKGLFGQLLAEEI
ncbi:MAG: ornithine cyclodeaminase [Gammaproteobacteria bacterium]|nr:ornithine cyclodeaminase [Gammaproteobacteria bacterium]